MNDNNKYCCDTMEFHLTTESEELVEYEPINREYSLKIFKSSYGTHQSILFCPWCGYKLPKSLSKEWELTLLNEEGIAQKILDDYGIESYAEKLIPPEFKTDEWWKKRGL